MLPWNLLRILATNSVRLLKSKLSRARLVRALIFALVLAYHRRPWGKGVVSWIPAWCCEGKGDMLFKKHLSSKSSKLIFGRWTSIHQRRRSWKTLWKHVNRRQQNWKSMSSHAYYRLPPSTTNCISHCREIATRGSRIAKLDEEIREAEASLFKVDGSIACSVFIGIGFQRGTWNWEYSCSWGGSLSAITVCLIPPFFPVAKVLAVMLIGPSASPPRRVELRCLVLIFPFIQN